MFKIVIQSQISLHESTTTMERSVWTKKPLLVSNGIGRCFGITYLHTASTSIYLMRWWCLYDAMYVFESIWYVCTLCVRIWFYHLALLHSTIVQFYPCMTHVEIHLPFKIIILCCITPIDEITSALISLCLDYINYTLSVKL